jgi:hypothetical protein
VLAAVLITVLTMSPGGDLFARFGHTAILVEDEAGARVYNFGAFKGNDPHLLSQFLRNAIPYYLSVNDVERFEWKYRDRDVLGQRLDLDDQKAQALSGTLKSLEYRNYRYDWFRNNCTTRARDVIGEAAGWHLQGPARMHPTLRAGVMDALWTVPSGATLISLSLNSLTDVPLDAWQELAMPADLAVALRQARRPDGRPLVAEEWLWRGPAPRPPRQPRWLQPLGEALLLYLLFVGAFARGRWARLLGGVGLCAWGVVATLLSLWFVLWSILPYDDGFLSVNLIGWSPLSILFAVDGVRILRGRPPGRWSRRAAVAVAAAILVGLAVSRQHHLRYAVYALAALALSWLTARGAASAPRSA